MPRFEDSWFLKRLTVLVVKWQYTPRDTSFSWTNRGSLESSSPEQPSLVLFHLWSIHKDPVASTEEGSLEESTYTGKSIGIKWKGTSSRSGAFDRGRLWKSSPQGRSRTGCPGSSYRLVDSKLSPSSVRLLPLELAQLEWRDVVTTQRLLVDIWPGSETVGAALVLAAKRHYGLEGAQWLPRRRSKIQNLICVALAPEKGQNVSAGKGIYDIERGTDLQPTPSK